MRRTPLIRADRVESQRRVLALRESIALELRLIERDAESGPGRKRKSTGAKIELRRGDVVSGLERTNAFKAVDHLGAGGGGPAFRRVVEAVPARRDDMPGAC